MKPAIVRNIERPDGDLVRKLGEFGVATVHEAQGRTGLMLPYMRPIYSEARIASPAVTVFCHAGDNLMIHAAIEMCRKGDVLVITTQSESTDGMFGELLATSCQAHGIAGVVIDAGVRDVVDLTKMQFPVFSKAISSQGTVKETAGLGEYRRRLRRGDGSSRRYHCGRCRWSGGCRAARGSRSGPSGRGAPGQRGAQPREFALGETGPRHVWPARKTQSPRR